MHKRSRKPASVRGFTLLEMMLVVVIIGLLATVVVFNFAGQGDKARIKTTMATLAQIKSAIDSYSIEQGGLPATLEVLTTGQPPLLDKVPKDAWKHDLVYFPTSSRPGKNFTLYSLGKDGQDGTADDIDIWTMDERS